MNVMLNGAFVVIPPMGGATEIVSFQYNPDSLKRNLTSRFADSSEKSQPAGGTRLANRFFAGAPDETVSFTLHLDSSNEPEHTSSDLGILPQLSALETLVYPALADINQSVTDLQQGSIEIYRAPAPRTLFVYGPQRVMPVSVQSYNIVEEIHDSLLNPISATVQVSLRVLSYNEFLPGTPVYNDYIAMQQSLERNARGGFSSDSSNLGIESSRMQL